MPVPGFIKVRTGDVLIDRIADSARATTEWLRANPVVDGILFTDQALVSGADGNIINHGFNRPYKGYIIVSSTVYGITSGDQRTLIDDTKSINIRVSSSTTANVWVF